MFVFHLAFTMLEKAFTFIVYVAFIDLIFGADFDVLIVDFVIETIRKSKSSVLFTPSTMLQEFQQVLTFLRSYVRETN